MEWTAEHDRLATNRRISQLYFNNQFAQVACEAAINFCDWVDILNAEATRTELERITKLHQEQLKKEQEVAISNKPDDGEGPAAAVTVDKPIKPIAPERHEIPVEAFDDRLVHRTQRLEIPVYKAEIPFFEVKKEYEVQQKAYEFKKEIPFKHEIPFRQDRGIKID